MSLPKSGLPYVDGLMFGQSLSGVTGISSEATVNAHEDAPPFRSPIIEKFFTAPQSLSASERAVVTDALSQYEAVSGLSFRYTTEGAAQIFVRKGNSKEAYGYTELRYFGNSASKTETSDVIFETAGIEKAAKGNFFYAVLLHELGHAVGLKHPHETAEGGYPILAKEQDSFAYTVMSYNSPETVGLQGVKPSPILPVGLMIYDVAAVQYLYGVNREYHANDDVYRFDGLRSLDGVDYADKLPKPYLFAGQALWDAGGHDVIDASEAQYDMSINLVPGRSIQAGHVIWEVAFGTELEDAYGGFGDDKIIGNALNNTLSGGKGDDLLDGRDGSDTVTFDRSPSFIQVNLAEGTAKGADTGSDLLLHIENIIGSAFGDKLYGDALANIIRGGAGNDFLSGEEGADRLEGDEGEDRLVGGAGDDVLDGGSGADVVDFTTASLGVNINFASMTAQSSEFGVDTLLSVERAYGGSGADTFTAGASSTRFFGFGGDDVMNGGDSDDVLFGGGGADLISGGNGSDVLYGGGGKDLLTGGEGEDVFFFAAEESTPAAYDSFMDFESGVDKIFIYSAPPGLSFDDVEVFARDGVTYVSIPEVQFEAAVLGGSLSFQAQDFIFVPHSV